VTSAQPLRAGKGTIYEAGTRVPLIVIWPGRVAEGSRTSALMQSTDFLPTFADMFGWKLPDGLHLDGVSLRPVLERNEAVRNEIFCHFPHPEAHGEYEMMPAITPATPASSVREGDWKLIRFYCDNPDQTDRYELYNLADDQGERHYRAASEPGRVKPLAARLDEILRDTEAVVPRPNPAYRGSARAGAKAATGI
jgi:arylsulfatase A-like enzyme